MYVRITCDSTCYSYVQNMQNLLYALCFHGNGVLSTDNIKLYLKPMRFLNISVCDKSVKLVP